MHTGRNQGNTAYKTAAACYMKPWISNQAQVCLDLQGVNLGGLGWFDINFQIIDQNNNENSVLTKFTKTVKRLAIKYKYEYEINVLKIWQVSAFTSEPWLKTKCVKKNWEWLTDQKKHIKKQCLGMQSFTYSVNTSWIT